jgi:hypothetical protein
MKFDRRFLGVFETRRWFGLVSGVVGWIPRLRFAPRGMTLTALRVAFSMGGQSGLKRNSPKGADYESPGHRPGNHGDRREQALKGRSNAPEPRSRSLGMSGPPP